ncbi:hypothetical protein [Longimicrobium sp.]|uniref:hypothetical protein n=1 Tax=Longimicrobium sp. TaxID=2029185 RepID=UPI002CD9AD70|nr:hypothetical protein [Longimicrobium sp.]HSU14775.1 hypothetical protein [Longimicrobium sp.]
MKPISRAALLVAAALLSACGGGDGTGSAAPGPGVLTVTLDNPNAGDRALVLTLSGPAAVTDVQPAVATNVVYTRTQGTTTRVAVFGTIADGALLQVSVPDAGRAGEYSATVQEAADAGNAARGSVSGYSATVKRGS